MYRDKRLASAVYPRRRGEHATVSPWALRRIGLSPQVRGTLFQWADNIKRERFIPAGAGNTFSSTAICSAVAVYPRRCGEHTPVNTCLTTGSGLSPQVRGTQKRKSPAEWQGRFIPAGAGNTSPAARRAPARTVYPRRCGEHTAPPGPDFGACGLSPQVRGTRAFGSARAKPPRFIPAGAGNTSDREALAFAIAVYPRRCGEHRCRHGRGRGACGLSPQVRGTHQRLAPVVFKQRFIPAGAGNTGIERALA